MWAKSRIRIFLRAALAAPGMHLALLAVSTCAQSPADVLASRGLHKIGTGTIWISRSELELQQHLRGLDLLRNRIQNTERLLADHVRQHRSQMATLKALRAALKTANGDQRRAIRKRIDLIEDSTVEPDELGGVAEVCQELISLSNQRNELLLATLAIRRLAGRLPEEYQSLRRDRATTAALTSAGNGARLGPARDYTSELRRLVDYERLVLTDELPIYLQSGLPRFAALLDEQTAVTFTWDKTVREVVITSSMARRAGLQIPVSATRRSLRIARRQYEATRVKVERLRLGKHVLSNVEVYVLPPDAEYLGARIGPAALGGLKADLQLDQLRLRIQS